jgi:UDP-N-acetylmuramyl pentapeptide phosphotransferase/UDP-N-acetylglucosamine-1-phosphate transferase
MIMTTFYAIAFLFTLFVIEISYFKIADYYNIIDKPNERSSHSETTLRGGGVIFCLAVLIFYVTSGFQYHFFTLGLFLLSLISFIDDIVTLSSKIRLAAQFAAVLLLFYQWQLFNLSWYWLIAVCIYIVGTINAYNFMDGINGITGSYSLVTILSLLYINNQIVEFTSNDLLIIVGLSLLVFNFFNFRHKAKCFAGDVGSISIVFIIIFLIGQLVLKTQNFAYILLTIIYVLDTTVTIFFRAVSGENILEAHRGHFYQFLANEKKWPHLVVASLYGVLQLLINLSVVFVVKGSLVLLISYVVLMYSLFIWIRFLTEGRRKLMPRSL